MSKLHDRGWRDRGFFRLLGFKPSLALTKRKRTTRLAENAKVMAHLKELSTQFSNNPMPRSRTHSVTSDPGNINDFVGINEEAANKNRMHLMKNASTRKKNAANKAKPMSHNEMVNKRIATAKARHNARENAAVKAVLSKAQKSKETLNTFHNALSARGATKSTAKNALAAYRSKRK